MGATFARSRTFVAGETLTATNLNGVETNILNNFTPAGMDDYSADVTTMRVTTDPYPAGSESLATSFQGEDERLRYMIAQISGRTYWYQDVYPIMAEGADVASAATCDIWAAFDGATKHITGTVTITSLGTAPQAGAWMKIIFDGALTLTHGANLNLPGSANITTAANDWAFVYADTTTLFRVAYFKADGTAVVSTGFAGKFFTAYASLSQNLTDVTFTLINMDTEEADASNVFDTVNKRVVIPNGETWLLEATVHIDHTVSTGAFTVTIYKNGVAWRRSSVVGVGVASGNIGTSPVASGNATGNGTDYYDVYAYQATTVTKPTLGGVLYTRFEGHRVK